MRAKEKVMRMLITCLSLSLAIGLGTALAAPSNEATLVPGVVPGLVTAARVPPD
jgi:hypothetical protein